MRVARPATLALCLALVGCIGVPDERPVPPAIDLGELGLGAGSAPVADAGWWTGFGDPQLDAMMQRALERSPTLAEAMARVRAARAAAAAVGAGLKPDAALDANETLQHLSNHDIIPPPYGGTLRWRGSAMLNLSWDLDFWGRQASLVEQAADRTLAARLDADGARLALTGAVVHAYVELDRQYALADIARRSVAQREAILAITRKRVEAGLDTAVELRTAEATLPQARVDLHRTEAELARAQHRLAALGVQGPDAEITRPALDLDAALPAPATLPADLLARRPDVLAARSAIDAADAGRSAARAAFYPDVNLRAFVGTSAIGLANLVDSGSATAGVGPALHLPLFDAGRLRADYEAADAEVDARVARYDAVVLRAVVETADALTDLDALAAERGEQQRALTAAEEAWRLAKLRYDAGLTNQLTVLAAESRLLDARRQQVEISTAQAIRRVDLLLAVGGSFQPPAAAVAAR